MLGINTYQVLRCEFASEAIVLRKDNSAKLSREVESGHVQNRLLPHVLSYPT